MSADPVLEINNVTRRFAGRAAVESASFALQVGRVAALLGPSGCGKSTLLRMIAGLETLDTGEIRLRGETVSSPLHVIAPERRGVGLVFQDNALFPHLNVQGNIAFGISHLPAAERQARVEAMLTRFHIEHLANAWPHTLSGGEQQRVAIARALAREPSLLLLDEPFSGLDGTLRERVRQSLMADLREAGATVLVVTHDADEAMILADDLILMNHGKLLQVGSPQYCYTRPVSAAAARLLGDAIVLPTVIASGIASTPFGPVVVSSMADGSAELVLRPEALSLAREGTPAMVIDVRFVGHVYRVQVLIDGHHPATLRVDHEPPKIGQQVRLAVVQGATSVLRE